MTLVVFFIFFFIFVVFEIRSYFVAGLGSYLQQSSGLSELSVGTTGMSHHTLS